MSKTITYKFRVYLTQQAKQELSSHLLGRWIGDKKYIPCVEVNPDGPLFHAIAEVEDSERGTLHVQIHLPYHHISHILGLPDNKIQGFGADDE